MDLHEYSPHFTIGALMQGAKSAEAFMTRHAQTLPTTEYERFWEGAILPLRRAIESAERHEAKRVRTVPA